MLEFPAFYVNQAMPLKLGSRLGSYEVIAAIGRGGMGEVFRAHDTKLQRDVALKILPDLFASDAERLARFQREAQILASLNHPRIGGIYGFEEAEGVRALVLELVEGPTLADRVLAGPIPFDESMRIALQLAEGLEAAHEKNLIHRDLKPANIKLTPDGDVKVLDFGLAKAMETEARSEDFSNSPTLTGAATRAGIILGTAAYMSPEQARGKMVDRRTDIWAFGCVLYEMLSGKRAFAGEDVSETLAATLKLEPDWSALPEELPWRLRELLRRCLIKDPRNRLRDIGDARLELMSLIADPHAGGVRSIESNSPAAASRKRLLAAAALGLIVGSGITGAVIFAFRRAPANTGNLTRTSIRLPASAAINMSSYPQACVAISPDGSRVVYFGGDATKQLYLRNLDDLEVRPIPGTEGGVEPFFSPDAQWIGFFTLDGALKKVSLTGTKPVTLAGGMPYASFVVGSWSDDGRIVFDTWNAGLRVIRSDGGPVTTLTNPKDEWHQDPQILPGTTTLIYTVLSNGRQRIESMSLDRPDHKLILENASHARYAASGHMLFMRDGGLMAAPFDAVKLKITGPAVSLPVNVMVDELSSAAPVAQLAVARNGTLIYAPATNSGRPANFVWVDRNGRVEPFASLPVMSPGIRLSPDGKRLVVSSREGSSVRIQILDMSSKTLTRFLDNTQDFPNMPVLSSDGKRLYYATFGTHQGAIYSQDVDSNSQPQRLLEKQGTYFGTQSLSNDGRWLLYITLSDAKTGVDLWALEVGNPTGKDIDHKILATEANEDSAALSPDGKWFAYSSDESGSRQIYLRQFPGGESKRRISTSTELNFNPQWSRDGRELFFQAEEGSKLMVVPIQTAPNLTVGEPRLLFEGRYKRGSDILGGYAVAPDGRFLMIQEPEKPARATELIVVPNWFSEIERLSPSGKR